MYIYKHEQSITKYMNEEDLVHNNGEIYQEPILATLV